MTFGLTCVNDSGELTISSELYTLCYLGKATFVSSVNYVGASDDSTAGDSVFSFSWPGPIVCAIGLKDTIQRGAAVESVTRPSTSSSAWTIVVRDFGTALTGPSGDSSAYVAQRTDSDVYVFGLPIVANLPSSGMAMYNSSGVLTCDLSKTLLAIKQRVALATDVLSQTVGSFTKPAIIGYPNGAVSSTAPVGGGQYRYTGSEGYWQWKNDGSIYRTDLVTARTLQDHPQAGIDLHKACSAILIEANGLT